MREMFKATLSLMVICLVVTFCISYVSSMTRDAILQKITQEANEQRKTVLKVAQRFEELKNIGEMDKDAILEKAFAGYAGETLVGYVFTSVPKGYGGKIHVTVGINKDGMVTGVSVGENMETPGLGSRAKEPGFVAQYVSKKIGKTIEVVKRQFSSENEIQSISGATITSDAITKAVNSAREISKFLIKDSGYEK